MTRRRTLALSAAALAALAALVVFPQLFGGHVTSAVEVVRRGAPPWLALGLLSFTAAFVCTVGAWRAALAAAGARICPRQAAARLGIGALVNAFTPAKLGDAVKIALCSKAIDAPGGAWRTGGAYAALGAARCLTLATLAAVAFASGAMPLWPAFVLAGAAALVGTAAACSARLRTHPRLTLFFAGLRALEHSPRQLAAVLAWTCGMQAARLGGTIAVAAALGLPQPVLAALIILPALDVASAVPLTPGGLGIGSGAVAVVLATRGIGMTEAIGVGLGIQLVETIVSVAVGTSGLAYLAQPSAAVRRWSLRVATVGGSAALAAGLGFFLDLL